jgi:hypothetical protein
MEYGSIMDFRFHHEILIFVTLGDEKTYKTGRRCPADLGGADQGAW